MSRLIGQANGQVNGQHNGQVNGQVKQAGIDSRGPRFAATLTSVVLAIALVTGRWEVLAAQALVFGIATLFGLQRSPYSYLFRWFVRPRLSPPAELEDPAPPRFAQAVGLFVTGLGLVLAAVGVPAAVPVFSAIALVAAVLTASIGFCLGCEIYLRLGLDRWLRRALA